MSCSEWKEVTLADISIGGKGSYGISASAVEYSEGLFTYLRITDISDDGIIIKDSLMSVDDKNAEKYLLEPNDIVFARTGNSTGRSYFYDGRDGKFVYAGFLIKFSLDPEKVNPKFMRYYTISTDYRNWVSSFSTGSTRGNINAQTYGSMKIKLPPRKQQDFLVEILSKLDEKIEINKQINKKLEEMAQAIFKHWFIDFEFPNEDGEPYKSSGGEMVESELGMIPKGWEVGVLGNMIKITSGKRPAKKSESKDNDFKFPLVGASSIMGYSENYNFDESVLVIGRVGTHGVVQRFNQKIWASDNTLVIISKAYEYVYQILKLIDYSALNRGSTQPLITQTDIKNYKILLPLSNILEKFENLVESLYKIHSNYCKENASLINIRDTLLPKLMSGEIRVLLDN